MLTLLRRYRRPVGAGTAVLLIAAVAWDWLQHPAQAPVAALAGLVPLAAAALAWALRAEPASTPAQLDMAAGALVRMAASQWRGEAAARGLLDPMPLRVRWHARFDLADHPENVGAVVTGLSDEITSFAGTFTQCQGTAGLPCGRSADLLVGGQVMSLSTDS
jgi:hypothetical protein